MNQVTPTRLSGGLLNAGHEAEIKVSMAYRNGSVSPFLKAIRRKVTKSIVISPALSGDVDENVR